MRKQLAIGLALGVLGAPVVAGDEEHGEQPQMYSIWKEVVKPGLMKQYEDAIKHMIQEFKAYQVDPEKVHWQCVSGAEMGVVFVTPVENFAGMDRMHASWMEAIEAIGQDKFEEMIRPAEEAMDHAEFFQVARDPSLSYVPEQPRLSKDEVQYIHYGFYYVQPGKQKEFEEIARGFVKLYEEKGLDTGWSIYRAISGADLPLYVVAQGARSEADYFTNRDRNREALGEEAKKLGDGVYAVVRRMEYMGALPRPDLSYPQPMEMSQAEQGYGHDHDDDHGHGHDHGHDHDHH